jgi:oxygen-independent coproporphyrinogen III oxidase
LQSIPPVGGLEYIDPDLAAAETMFLGLRLLDGIDLAEATARAGLDLEAKYRQQIAELLELGLLEQKCHRLRLTRDAYLIANQVFTRFLG